ncbi:MAG: alpha/beta fold hydrolase [bacterium]|nr:alpha/beta fold hydrolase [bacterium]
MIRRLPYWVAAVALLAALIGLSFESRRVAHGFQMLPGQVPVAIWEPGPARGHHAASDFDRPIPVVILCHGFSGNIQMMSTLARRLAGAGYAVITPDFRGHGQNANPFAGTASAGGLLADIDAALLYARMQPHYDGQRIVLAGHSMGASAVLEHAQRDTGVAGVIAISGGANADRSLSASERVADLGIRGPGAHRLAKPCRGCQAHRTGPTRGQPYLR